MTWIALDDGFISHPKVLQLPHKSIVLHISGLTYCCTQLTDGEIPKAAMSLVLAQARVSAASVRPLIEVGMWRDLGHCYVIHDYLKYQPSREQVLAKRDRWAEQKRRQRGGKGEMSTADSTPDSSAESACPLPSPPLPTTSSTPTTHHHPHGVDDDEVIDLITAELIREAGTQPVNRRAYTAAVRADVIARYGDRIAHFRATRPDCDAHTIARRLMLEVVA